MAAKTFDDILSQIAEDDRKVLTGLVEKHPDLKGGWMRQDDYSRKLDEQRNEFTKLKTYQEQMDAWRAENWLDLGKDDQGNEIGMTKGQKAALDRATELEKLVAEGGEMNFDQIKDFLNKEIETRGVVTKAEFEKAVSEKANEFTRVADNGVYLGTDYTELGWQYYNEFGKFPPRGFFKGLANKGKELGLNSLEDAYVRATSEDRTKLQEQRMKDEIEKARLAGLEEGKRAAAMGANDQQGNIPTDQGSPLVAALNSKMFGTKEEARELDDLSLTSPAVAEAAAKAFAEKGHF